MCDVDRARRHGLRVVDLMGHIVGDEPADQLVDTSQNAEQFAPDGVGGNIDSDIRRARGATSMTSCSGAAARAVALSAMLPATLNRLLSSLRSINRSMASGTWMSNVMVSPSFR